MEAQENKDILEKVKEVLGEMIGLIKELTDTFSMSEWNVVWIDDEGKSHGKRFYWKTEAREFYDDLPYYQKDQKRVSW